MRAGGFLFLISAKGICGGLRAGRKTVFRYSAAERNALSPSQKGFCSSPKFLFRPCACHLSILSTASRFLARTGLGDIDSVYKIRCASWPVDFLKGVKTIGGILTYPPNPNFRLSFFCCKFDIVFVNAKLALFLHFLFWLKALPSFLYGGERKTQKYIFFCAQAFWQKIRLFCS